MNIELRKVREILQKVVPAIDWSNVAEGDSLERAGLDSLDKASFFLELEEATGVSISDEEYQEIDTMDQVVTAVRTKVDQE